MLQTSRSLLRFLWGHIDLERWKLDEFGLISVPQSGIDKVRHYVENNKWRAENVLIEPVTPSLWFCKQEKCRINFDSLYIYIFIHTCTLHIYIYICVYYIIYIYRLCEIYPGFLPQTWNPDLSPLQTQSLRWKGSENLSRNVPRKRTADIGTDRNSTRPVGKAQVVPSGNLTLCNGKSPLLVGKPSKAWAMFHI